MTEAKKGPAEKRAVARSRSAEKRATAREQDAEERAETSLNAALRRFADRIEASNAVLSEAMQNSLAFLKDVLHDDQKNRRFWRWVLIFGLVLNFGILGALGYNAIEGARARAKLVDRSAEQGELLKKVDATLSIVQSVTGPAAQKKQAESLGAAFASIDCNNQHAIQRAMTQLGYEYPLTGGCK